MCALFAAPFAPSFAASFAASLSDNIGENTSSIFLQDSNKTGDAGEYCGFLDGVEKVYMSTSETNKFYFIVGDLQVEVTERQQFFPNGKLYRIKGRKGHRLNMDQFNLFVFYSKTKLAGEWQKSGENTHLFSDVYAKMNDSGVMMRKYYIKNGEMLPGVPKLFLSHDQWLDLMRGIANLQNRLYPTFPPGPCFCNRSTHFEGESFIGCSVCLPFVH